MRSHLHEPTVMALKHFAMSTKLPSIHLHFKCLTNLSTSYHLSSSCIFTTHLLQTWQTRRATTPSQHLLLWRLQTNRCMPPPSPEHTSLPRLKRNTDNHQNSVGMQESFGKSCSQNSTNSLLSYSRPVYETLAHNPKAIISKHYSSSNLYKFKCLPTISYINENHLNTAEITSQSQDNSFRKSPLNGLAN